MKSAPVITALALLALATAAGGQTVTPPAPVCLAPGPAPADSERPAMPARPVRPPCIDSGSMISHCPTPIMKKYNADVRAYNQAMIDGGRKGQDFIDRLNHWMRQANAYAQCEVGAFNAEMDAGN
jgi:hypothetical protein